MRATPTAAQGLGPSVGAQRDTVEPGLRGGSHALGQIRMADAHDTQMDLAWAHGGACLKMGR